MTKSVRINQYAKAAAAALGLYLAAGMGLALKSNNNLTDAQIHHVTQVCQQVQQDAEKIPSTVSTLEELDAYIAILCIERERGRLDLLGIPPQIVQKQVFSLNSLRRVLTDVQSTTLLLQSFDMSSAGTSELERVRSSLGSWSSKDLRQAKKALDFIQKNDPKRNYAVHTLIVQDFHAALRPFVDGIQQAKQSASLAGDSKKVRELLRLDDALRAPISDLTALVQQ
jgi:hypothetical protein